MSILKRPEEVIMAVLGALPVLAGYGWMVYRRYYRKKTPV